MDLDEVKRLGKNIGGYFGERIDIGRLLREMLDSASRCNWEIDELVVTPGRNLPALRRATPLAKRRVYISTGIHGDEPAGPLALSLLLQNNAWPKDVSLWICPCLNPLGFELNQRENADGIDLNRDYRNPKTAEVSAHVNWLNRQPHFDLSLCLHEDWESHGFYIYELNHGNNPALAPRVISSVATVCPIDRSAEIEGRPASNGIINPDIDPKDRPDWPEAFYLIEHKTRQSCTLEAPSDFPLEVRVKALVKGVETALGIK